jgi:hypothetical protein
MALLTSLFATALLMGLGLSLVLLGMSETTLAGHDRDARALAFASRAALTVAVADLRALPSWSALIAAGETADMSASPGRFVDSTVTPAVPWGGSLDLRALTTRLQADSDAGTLPGGDAPLWRLFEYGRLDRLVPAASRGSPYYLVVWVADDRADGDGEPAVDANHIVVVRAVAYGPGDGKAVTEASVMRQPIKEPPDPVRILTIRPGV